MYSKRQEDKHDTHTHTAHRSYPNLKHSIPSNIEPTSERVLKSPKYIKSYKIDNISSNLFLHNN